ncbi:hypothetical protein BC629DRAFT_1289752, partial [Irpex lacteus]
SALYLYDWMTTLSEEVNVIWRRKWTSITWLYALTRYSAVLDQILFLIPPWNFVVLSLATRTAVILGDVLVLVITWTKTAQAYREARRMNIGAPLTTILFRDGATNDQSILYLSSLMASQQGQFTSCTSKVLSLSLLIVRVST